MAHAGAFVACLGGSLFVVALEVGGPAGAALFLADAVMGFVARALPKMNVFIVGFPMKIGVGLFLLAVSAPLFLQTLRPILFGLEDTFLGLLVGI